MNIAELRSRYQGFTDDEIVAALQATKYTEFSTQEIKDVLGVKPPKRSLLAAANDTVIEAANAAAGMASSVGSFIAPGNRVSQFIDDKFIRAGEESQSDAVKAEKARMASELDQAGGAWDEVKAVGGYVARNPLLAAAQAAGSFAIPGLGIKGAEGLARAAGIGARGVVNTGLGTGAALGAAGAGGDAASTAYDLAIKAGASPEQAEAAARQASVIPAVIGGAGGLIGAERLIAGASGMKGGLMARALKTAGVEGVQEGIEEGVTQYEGQRAAMPFDPSIDPAKGVAGAATLGAMLGAATGGGVALLTKERADQAAAALPSASSADEAIELAMTATDVPLTVPPNFDADAAMGNLDTQRRKDEAGLRDFSGRSVVAGQPGAAPAIGAAAEPTAEVIDSPFNDRLLTLREQIGDERVRNAIRQNLGVDALGDALYYATQADRPDASLEAPIPDVTRDRLLGMAEAIVARATLRPVNRPGVTGQQAPAGLPAPAGQPRIGLDTTPTGTVRVDAQGNAAPETRADVIAGRRQRQDGMTQQVEGRPLPRDGVMVGGGRPSAPLTLKERAQAMRRRLALGGSAAGGLQALTQVENADTGSAQRMGDGAVLEAEGLIDAVATEAFRNQGFGGLNIESRRLVLSHVFRLGHDQKIRRRIVELVPVDVVHNLIGKQGSANDLLGNPAILAPALSSDADAPVAALDAASALVRAAALVAAKDLGRNNGRWIAGEAGAAMSARKIDSRQVSTPSSIDELGSSAAATAGGPPTVANPSTQTGGRYEPVADLAGTPRGTAGPADGGGDLGSRGVGTVRPDPVDGGRNDRGAAAPELSGREADAVPGAGAPAVAVTNESKPAIPSKAPAAIEATAPALSQEAAADRTNTPEVIELRQRLSVLRALKECLA